MNQNPLKSGNMCKLDSAHNGSMHRKNTVFKVLSSGWKYICQFIMTRGSPPLGGFARPSGVEGEKIASSHFHQPANLYMGWNA